MVDVWLPYGKTEVCARIPMRNYLGNIEPKEIEGLKDPRSEIERALNEPIGTPRLSELAKPDSRVVIVVNDQTRPTPTHLIMPPLLDELNKAGVKDNDITIIIGCGSHRSATTEEIKTLLGAEIVNRIRISSHDYRAKDLVYLGKTRKQRSFI